MSECKELVSVSDSKELEVKQSPALSSALSLDREEESEKDVILVSCEKKHIRVAKQLFQTSKMMSTTLESEMEKIELQDEQGQVVKDEQGNPIVLESVPLSHEYEILKLVIQYLEYHLDNPAKPIEKPLKSNNMKELVCAWDALFVEKEQEVLLKLVQTSNALDISPLLDLICVKVASMIKGKTPEQIRQTFHIVNDFTPEEEEKMKEEFKWTEMEQ